MPVERNPSPNGVPEKPEEENKVLVFHGQSPLPADYPDRITQEEIVAEKLLTIGISEDQARLAAKTQLRERLRERMFRKLQRGATVEPGIHTAWIEDYACSGYSVPARAGQRLKTR